jgi:DNA-binding CsgD family transcriptional regulator/phosphatidylserine synthase
MQLFRILYWGLAYTAGIACLTGLGLRYLQLREKPTLRLILFLLPTGFSVVCLSMLEFFRGHPVYQTIAGYLALVGASLVVATLPSLALLFKPLERRRRLTRAFRFLGWSLALVNAAAFFLPGESLGGWLQLITMLALGAAVFVSMGWISRSRPRWGDKPKPAPMLALIVVFGLALALDLLRAFLPGLRFLGDRYLVFPGFYAFLNVFLFYSHVNVWARELREAGEAPSPAAATGLLLKRFGISEREGEVLALLIQGYTYREMADSLCLSLATIKTHVSHLYEKTGTRNKVELLNITSGRIGRSDDSAPPTGNST